MFLRLLPTVFFLCACASPSPQFFGAAKHSVTIDARPFTVFQAEKRVQVIRHGYAGRVARREIADQMMRAVADATGCTPVVSSFQGDSGEMRGRITC